MNDQNLFAALNDKVIMIGVVFLNSSQENPPKVYAYKALKEQGFTVGCYAAVPSRSSFSVVKVVEITDNPCFDPSLSYRWAIQVVSMETYERIGAQEKA